jgi:hypothetical protein
VRPVPTKLFRHRLSARRAPRPSSVIATNPWGLNSEVTLIHASVPRSLRVPSRVRQGTGITGTRPSLPFSGGARGTAPGLTSLREA